MVPTLFPFFFHWYAGLAPPFVGVAVKVTLLPEHIAVLLAAMVIAGVAEEFTDIVIPGEVAVGVAAQVELLVISQVIKSPFAKAEVV